MSHRNARTTFQGRLLIVRAAPGRLPAGAYREGDGDLAQVCEEVDRPVPGRGRGRAARPLLTTASCPRRTSEQVEARIIEPRERERRGPDWLGAELGVPARTVSRILARHRVPRLCELDPITGEVIRASKATAVRYERTGPASWSTWTSRRSAGSPTAAAGVRTAAPRRCRPRTRAQDRLRLRALPGRRPLPVGLLRDPPRREGPHLRGVPGRGPSATSLPMASPGSSG